jgi:hypothetical protein
MENDLEGRLMKRTANWWMLGCAACFLLAAVLFLVTWNWWLLGLSVAFQLGIFAFGWAERGILKDIFKILRK